MQVVLSRLSMVINALGTVTRRGKVTNMTLLIITISNMEKEHLALFVKKVWVQSVVQDVVEELSEGGR